MSLLPHRHPYTTNTSNHHRPPPLPSPLPPPPPSLPPPFPFPTTTSSATTSYLCSCDEELPQLSFEFWVGLELNQSLQIKTKQPIIIYIRLPSGTINQWYSISLAQYLDDWPMLFSILLSHPGTSTIDIDITRGKKSLIYRGKSNVISLVRLI